MKRQLYYVPERGKILPPGALPKSWQTGELEATSYVGHPYDPAPQGQHSLHVVPVETKTKKTKTKKTKTK